MSESHIQWILVLFILPSRRTWGNFHKVLSICGDKFKKFNFKVNLKLWNNYTPRDSSAPDSQQRSVGFWVWDLQNSACSLMLMAAFYYGQGCKAKSAKRKDKCGEIQRKLGVSFQESAPTGVTQRALNFSSKEVRQHMRNVVYWEAGLRLEAWGGPVGTIYLVHTRLPKGKQVFSINHIVCKNSTGPVDYSYHLGKSLH